MDRWAVTVLVPGLGHQGFQCLDCLSWVPGDCAHICDRQREHTSLLPAQYVVLPPGTLWPMPREVR